MLQSIHFGMITVIDSKMVWIAFALSLFTLSLAHDPLGILQPPLITIPDRPQKLYFADGERVLVKCSAAGIPSPEYEWQRNDKIIEADNEFIKFDSKTGTLEIPYFTDREEGVFVCRASNIVGENIAVSVSYPQTLVVTLIESFKKSSHDHPPEINSNEYAYARLKCSDQGRVVGDPNDIIYAWYITQESRQMSLDNGRLFISNDGSLHFTYTLKMDESERPDTYHCGISSLKIRIIRLGPPMILNVQESSPTALKPVMMYSNSGYQAILSTTAQLECVFSGYDPASDDKLPVITWFDDTGNPIVSDGKKYILEDKNRKLRIVNVQETDDKNYGCQGATSAGSSRVHPVYLNVTSPPIWVEGPRRTTAIDGSTVKIHCNARSLSSEEASLRPVWYINGQLFTEVGKSNAVLSDDMKVMTLNNVKKPNDILCVQCMVSNSIGQTTGNACVNVIEPIKLSIDCQRCQNSRSDNCTCNLWKISKGDSVEFRLAWKTDPAFTDRIIQEWTFKDKIYKIPQLPPFWNRDGVSHVYHFNTRNLSDEEFYSLDGKYSFKMYHAYESREENITIQVKNVTRAPRINLTLDCQRCWNSRSDNCTCNLWEISKGDSVEFRLAWKTDPDYVDEVTQEWTFKNETYKVPQLPPFWNHDEVAQVYHFNTSNLSVEQFKDLDGKYHFKVYHTFDSKEKSITIKVKDVTPAPPVSSPIVEMWIIVLVSGLVFLLFFIILVIFVIVSRRQQKEVFSLDKKETGPGLLSVKEQSDKLPNLDDEGYVLPVDHYNLPVQSGDDESLAEDGDENDIHFKEDGSFIGMYRPHVKLNSSDRPTESTTHEIC